MADSPEDVGIDGAKLAELLERAAKEVDEGTKAEPILSR